MHDEAINELESERDALKAECDRLRDAAIRQNHEIAQILGRALGYPRYCDDQKNFPGTTDADGVCVGDHTAESLAAEVADKIDRLEHYRDRARSQRNEALEQLEIERRHCAEWREMFYDVGSRIEKLRAQVESGA